MLIDWLNDIYVNGVQYVLFVTTMIKQGQGLGF
jgi:hypothetical protein